MLAGADRTRSEDHRRTGDGTYAAIEPQPWPSSQEWRTGMQPGHHFTNHARLVNTILCACILVLIGLVVGLGIFLLDR
jgi:hypothetical protein